MEVFFLWYGICFPSLSPGFQGDVDVHGLSTAGAASSADPTEHVSLLLDRNQGRRVKARKATVRRPLDNEVKNWPMRIADRSNLDQEMTRAHVADS